jgi:hypothetical protein
VGYQARVATDVEHGPAVRAGRRRLVMPVATWRQRAVLHCPRAGGDRHFVVPELPTHVLLAALLPEERDEEVTAASRGHLDGRASTVTPLGDAERGSFGS